MKKPVLIRALYTDQRGAGCSRTVASAAEAEKILRGGYGAQEVRLETEDGTVIGERYRMTTTDDRRLRWFWSYDKAYFE